MSDTYTPRHRSEVALTPDGLPQTGGVHRAGSGIATVLMWHRKLELRTPEPTR